MMSPQVVEESIGATLRELALVQFCVMQGTAQYGAAGRERVLSGYCRYLLSLPPSRELTSSDTASFWEKIEQETSAFKAMGTDDLKKLATEMSFSIGEETYKQDQDYALNKLLEEAGSDRRIFLGHIDEHYAVFMWGPTLTFEQDGFTISIIESEEVRSPSAILPMIAVIGKTHHIAIRKEALRVIFTEKWRSFYSNKSTLPPFSSYEQMNQAWKQATLKAYGMTNLEKLNQREPIFIDEMIETTIAHEVSHGVFEQLYPDNDIAALGKALSLKPEGIILEVLGELFAEWLPPHKNSAGAIPYIANIGVQGKQEKSQRMFLRYISDSWFLGNYDQHYLADTTDLFISSLMPFVTSPEAIDFKGVLTQNQIIYQLLLSEWERIVKEAKRRIETATYEINGLEVDFERVSQSHHRHLAGKNLKDAPPESIRYKTYFWSNMLTYMEKTKKADETYRGILRYLEGERDVVKNNLLALLLPDAKARKPWEGNLRGYLLQQCEEKLAPLLRKQNKRTQRAA